MFSKYTFRVTSYQIGDDDNKDDLIYAGSDDDVINAGVGNNTIYAGLGNNTITSSGINTIFALSGSVRFILGEGDGIATTIKLFIYIFFYPAIVVESITSKI
ncbi:hypothetical protein NIES4075_28550 [Tolypothrix sp. NIES-4075]|uniref:hypothetical protein n=1 Tax=Tolypothrix sp. NIES-4075 TaxID=2005459 RepID=UPI000B5C5500|nr:hypothetical protein [Tolypothrix sp. NIES-4075]GAX41858.1 hypothetical protein NIES4075_28550 [Tolypothrix sp. NIES-4075]